MKIFKTFRASLALLAVLVAFGTACSVIPTYRPDTYPVSATTTGTAPVGSPSASVRPQSSVPPVSGDANVSPAAAQGLDFIQVGQKLTVSFSDTPTQVLPQEVTVREDGTITLMFNREFKAANKTRGELEKEIHAAYFPSYFRQLTVNIRPEERFFTVGGEVRAPGRQVYSGSLTVLQGIAAAGGFNEFANKRKVEVIRGDRTKVTVDCIKAQEDPRLNLPIYPGDQIHVHRRGF